MNHQNMSRQLVLEGCLNVRDIGGYPTLDGKVTRWKVILRADNLDKLPPASQQQLVDYGVRTVIDLRDHWETEQFPNVFENSATMSYVKRPLLGTQSIYQKTEHVASLSSKYNIILDDCQNQINAIIEAIADSNPGCTIIHCSAGKDRTGLITALLLSLANVDGETIAEDYSLSEVLLIERIQEWRRQALEAGRDMNLVERDIGSKRETMLETLEYLHKRWSNIDTYLEQCGISATRINQIRTKLLAGD
jgi:protein-tyrosine phosphatase